MVSLYSAPGRAFRATLEPSHVSIDVVGQGAGGLTATLPRETAVATGTAVVLPGIKKRIVGYVTRTALDARDPLERVFIETPSNLEELDRKSTRLNSSHIQKSRMPSSA